MKVEKMDSADKKKCVEFFKSRKTENVLLAIELMRARKESLASIVFNWEKYPEINDKKNKVWILKGNKIYMSAWFDNSTGEWFYASVVRCEENTLYSRTFPVGKTKGIKIDYATVRAFLTSFLAAYFSMQKLLEQDEARKDLKSIELEILKKYEVAMNRNDKVHQKILIGSWSHWSGGRDFPTDNQFNEMGFEWPTMRIEKV